MIGIKPLLLLKISNTIPNRTQHIEHHHFINANLDLTLKCRVEVPDVPIVCDEVYYVHTPFPHMYAM